MKVVCYGDSNTYGYDPRGYFGGQYDKAWPEILAVKTGWNIINEGMNGREIQTGSVFFPKDTDLLIIMLGTNDLLQARSPEAACEKMEWFLNSLALKRDKILLIAPPPMKLGQWVQSKKLIDSSSALGKHYRCLAKRLGVRFADAGEWNISLAYDGVHLTEKGHIAFADELYNYLVKGE
ncbi:MAG: lipase [Oscillospiraceae bacterium]|nr:lipase [Oscillospiraceae bacterium]